MDWEFMYLFGCLIAGNIVTFAWLWSVIHSEEEEAEAWKEEQREQIKAMRGN